MDNCEIGKFDIEFAKTMGNDTNSRVEFYSGRGWQEKKSNSETSEYVYKMTDMREISKLVTQGYYNRINYNRRWFEHLITRLIIFIFLE